MSLVEIRQFYEALKSDPELGKALMGIETAEAFVKVAGEAGFAFTVEDLEAYKRETRAFVGGEKLSEAELDRAVGGSAPPYRTFVTIWYGCDEWEAAGWPWTATAGHCGSCNFNRDGYCLCTLIKAYR